MCGNPIKIPVLLLALAAATPALAQTSAVPALAKAPSIEEIAPAVWEFSPDFLRDQSRILWNAPNTSDNKEFFVTTLNGAGVPTGEVIKLLGANNRNWGTITATFDKKGRLQDQVMNGLLGATSLGNSDSQAEMTPSDVAIKTFARKGLLVKRAFTLKFPDLKGTLICDYDERGRRQRDVFTASDGDSRTINYFYDAKGLNKITDGTTTSTIERDANGKMRSLSVIKNGLLTRSATPIKDDKGTIIGTRTEDYSGGILQEVNEITQAGGTSSIRTSETSSDTTTFEDDQQTTEKKFEFRMDIGPKSPGVAAVESRKRTIYRNAKIATEEIFRGGKLAQRSEFNENGIIEKVTNFNADGSVASEIDLSKSVPYADGGIIRRDKFAN